MDAGYRRLDYLEVLQRGDEIETIPDSWQATQRVGEKADVLNVYRRPLKVVPLTAPTLNDDLKLILSKEQEHVALVEENNDRRDRALELGQELGAARKQFADRHRDRLFVIAGRLIDTTGGAWVTKPVEVVAE